MTARTAVTRIDLAWGECGLEARKTWAETVVVVDVLSFSTAVDVALAKGATVWPSRWRDARAEDLVRRHGARVAVPRRAMDADHPLSLSPASLAAHLAPGEALVLPSPNGSHLSALAATDRTRVFTACLRNARAVAAALPAGTHTLVVAAGERWPDGSLRPAVEDALGAGAVLAALAARRPTPVESPEARHARRAFEALAGDDVHAFLRESVSGRELIDGGFSEDVALAAALGASSAVPHWVDGAYRDASA